MDYYLNKYRFIIDIALLRLLGTKKTRLLRGASQKIYLH